MPNKINNLKKIPVFKNEDEEANFWNTHDTTEYFNIAKPFRLDFPNLQPTTETISVRMPISLLSRLKKFANQRDVPYQSLLKILLDEKLPT